LERKEEEVKPKRHAEMSLVSEGQGGVANAFQVREGILQSAKVSSHASRNSRLHEAIAHAPSCVVRKNEDNLKWYVALNVVIVSPFLSNASGTSTAGDKATDPTEEPEEGDIIME